MTDPYSLGMLKHLGINQEEDEVAEEDKSIETAVKKEPEKEQYVATNSDNTAAYLEFLRQHGQQRTTMHEQQAYAAYYQPQPQPQLYPQQQMYHQLEQPIHEQPYNPSYYQQQVPHTQQPYEQQWTPQENYETHETHEMQVEKIALQWLEKNVPFLLRQMVQAQNTTKKKKR